MDEYKVKILDGPGIEEVIGMEAIMLPNLEKGYLELKRVGGEIPFEGYGWNEITDITGEEKGTFSKKKIIKIYLKKKNKPVQLQVDSKLSVKEIVSDLIAFINASKEKHPKGPLQESFESLKEVLKIESAKKAFDSLKEKTSSGIKKATNVISKKDDEEVTN